MSEHVGASTRANQTTSQSGGDGEPTVRPNVAELYLVRHGTTTWNVTNRYRGRRDVPLDTQGWADALAAARDPEMFARYVAAPLDAACPNGERLMDAQDRIVEALLSIGEHHKGERIAGVTHAVMIRLVAAKLLGRRDEGWRIPVGRGSLTKLEVENGRIRLLREPDGDDVD